jgi:hypothetical protein
VIPLGTPCEPAHDVGVRLGIWFSIIVAGIGGAFGMWLLVGLLGPFQTGLLGFFFLVVGWFATFRTLETFIFIVITAILIGVAAQSFPIISALIPGTLFSFLFLPLLVLRLFPQYDLPPNKK